MRRMWIVLRKEILDNLRDRRSLSSALLTPLITPLFLVALIIIMGQTLLADPQEKPIELYITGAENAPGLVAFLNQNNVHIQPGPADPQAAVRSGAVDVVLIIPPDYGEYFRKGEPAPIQAVIDTSRQSAMGTIQRAQSLLETYGQTIGVLRLQARGIDPQITRPLAIAAIDMATPQSSSLMFLNMMPFLILTVIFVGGMYVIIDMTAGERERGSLEPLLINPASRTEFALGKLLASIPFTIVTLIMTLAAYYVMFTVFPLEDYANMPMNLDQNALMAVFWLSLPMVLLASAMQMLIATFTRSFKEAQTYLSFLPMVVGFPSAFLAFLPLRANQALIMIPTFGQSLLINQILRGEPVATSNLLLSSGVTVLVALVLVFVSVRLYHREQILLGR